MTIHSQQSSQVKTATGSNSSGPMSIICTGPVIPSVIYHHHMYYLSSPNSSSGGNCCMPYSQSIPSNFLLPNVSNFMNSFVESVVSGQQANLGALLAPRITFPVPVTNSYSPTMLVEPGAVKVNPSFLNQIDACVTLDRSNLKESSSKSSSASSSCSTSSYFASLSSPSSTCLSPFSSSSSSSPSTPSLPSSPPTNSSPVEAAETATVSDSKRKELDQKSNKASTSTSSNPTSTINAPSQNNGIRQHFFGLPQQQQQALGRGASSLTPSVLVPPLLSGNASAFVPGAFFGATTGSLPSQATGVISAIHNSTQQAQPVLSYRDYYARFGVHYTPVPWNQSYGMERVWMSEFRRVFSAFYNELWSIQPVDRKPTGIKLHMFVDSAKVRFCCDKCGHSWTSMKGRIVFWFNLLPPNFNSGVVTIKLFGQKCEMCKLEVYEQPMWYPEEVTKVLMNLFNRVGQIFYGFEKTKFEKQRRMGKPRTPHNKYLCQACLEGICLSKRRACVAAGQQVPPCPVADQITTTTGNEETEQHTQISTEENISLTSDSAHESNNQIKVEDDDEGDYSEDSGIVESDADKAGQEESNKAKVVQKIKEMHDAELTAPVC